MIHMIVDRCHASDTNRRVIRQLVGDKRESWRRKDDTARLSTDR